MEIYVIDLSTFLLYSLIVEHSPRQSIEPLIPMGLLDRTNASASSVQYTRFTRGAPLIQSKYYEQEFNNLLDVVLHPLEIISSTISHNSVKIDRAEGRGHQSPNKEHSSYHTGQRYVCNVTSPHPWKFQVLFFTLIIHEMFITTLDNTKI